MQTFAKIATLAATAATAYAGNTAWARDTVKITNNAGKDLLKGRVGGSLDLLKNDSEFDVMLTLNQELEFLSSYKPVEG